jgi:hypothetical protein
MYSTHKTSLCCRASFTSFPFFLSALLIAPLIRSASVERVSGECVIAMSAPSSLPSKVADLKQADIDKLHSLGTAWAGLNGLLVMRQTGIQVAPISLLPMPFPRRVYKQVYEVMVSTLPDAPNRSSKIFNHLCRSSTSTILCIA